MANLMDLKFINQKVYCMEIDQCNVFNKVLFFSLLADWTRVPTKCGGLGSRSAAMLLPGNDILNFLYYTS